MASPTKRRTAAARLSVGAVLGAALVAPVVIGLSAQPASANTNGTQIDSPNGDVTYNQPFDGLKISATVNRTNDYTRKGALDGNQTEPDNGNPVTFALTDPNGAVMQGPWVNQGTRGGPLPVNNGTYLSSSSGLTGGPGGPLINGNYTLKLTGGGSTCSVRGCQGSPPINQTRTITLAIPPAAPTGIAANPSSSTVVHLTWDQNTEPDRQYYDIMSNGYLLGRVQDSQVCSSGSCSVDIPFSKDKAAGTHSFALRAYRSTAPGSSDTLVSAQSATVSTTLAGPPPPPPPPSPTPAGGGTGGGTTGGTGAGTGGGEGGGSTGAGAGTGTGTGTGGVNPSASPGAPIPVTKPGDKRTQTQLAVQFKDFAKISGILKLPPLPAAAALAGEAPIPFGTFAPTLAYGDQLVPETIRTLQNTTTTDSLATSLSKQFNGRALYRDLAIALLLVIASAHLRTWMRKEDAISPAPGHQVRRRNSDGGYDW